MTPTEFVTSRQIDAAPQAVYDAWLAPAQLLRWFAEHCEVEPHIGGAYRFWGRFSLGAPQRPRTGSILRLQPAQLLEFTWVCADTPSTVLLELAPAPREGVPGTQLKLTQRFERAPEIARAMDVLDDWWRLTVANLRAFLGGQELVRVDFTDPAPRVQLSVYIAAPRARVYAALMDPVLLNRWIASQAIVDPRPGGAYSYGWTYPVGDRQVAAGPTRILECIDNEMLATDWPDWRGDTTKTPTRVVWRLTDEGPGTRVTLLHEGFAQPVDVSDYPYGWRPYLASLKTLAASA